MSQFNPPSPPAAGPPVVGPGYLPPDGYQRPPLSVAAVVGFVSSLVFCLPFVAPFIGLVCGLTGIFTTSGGQRRGRGLAIAAIPISLFLGTADVLLTFGGYKMLRGMFGIEQRYVRPLFQTGGEPLADKVTKLYPHTTRRFRQQLNEPQLAAWVEQVRKKHGTLQSVQRTPQWLSTDRERRFVVAYVASFTQGSAPYAVLLVLEPDLQFRVDDLRVDGESPLTAP